MVVVLTAAWLFAAVHLDAVFVCFAPSNKARLDGGVRVHGGVGARVDDGAVEEVFLSLVGGDGARARDYSETRGFQHGGRGVLITLCRLGALA